MSKYPFVLDYLNAEYRYRRIVDASLCFSLVETNGYIHMFKIKETRRGV